jgi:hypothetical protein
VGDSVNDGEQVGKTNNTCFLQGEKFLVGDAVFLRVQPPRAGEHGSSATCVDGSVADPGCLSRIPDLIFTHPGSRIPDLGSRIQKQQQKTGVKKFFCHTIFCSHEFHKTEHYFIFDKLKKKIWPNFPRIIEDFTQKIVTKPSKIWVWDPGSRIWKKPNPDPGSRGQKASDPESQIRIRNTGRWDVRRRGAAWEGQRWDASATGIPRAVVVPGAGERLWRWWSQDSRG